MSRLVSAAISKEWKLKGPGVKPGDRNLPVWSGSVTEGLKCVDLCRISGFRSRTVHNKNPVAKVDNGKVPHLEKPRTLSLVVSILKIGLEIFMHCVGPLGLERKRQGDCRKSNKAPTEPIGWQSWWWWQWPHKDWRQFKNEAEWASSTQVHEAWWWSSEFAGRYGAGNTVAARQWIHHTWNCPSQGTTAKYFWRLLKMITLRWIQCIYWYLKFSVDY